MFDVPTSDAEVVKARRLRVAGRVQAVGFRPFVYRLAHRLGLSGSVLNAVGEVEIRVEGRPESLRAFERGLLEEAPPLARPRIVESHDVTPRGAGEFTILPSRTGDAPDVHVPPDCFTCDDCLAELRDPAARRYRYPFINCTQCGPRYTLIESLPYDRPGTSMAGFELCEDCRREYQDPLDRRFHAEPLACPACGPGLTWADGDGERPGTAEALAACVAALRAGRVVAVKGVGGYHLMCDARSEAAVRRLRERKPRPHKPLAVMFPARGVDGLEAVRAHARPDAAAAARLADPIRPIVLVERRADSDLAASIAPALAEIGAFLPYSPLHHLLLDDFGGPLVATSGNLAGEPVLTDEAQARRRLARVADAFLEHDRPILRPADDPVYRPIGGIPRPIRLGRGNAPAELDLPGELPEPVLAVGGHLKVTVTLAWGRRAVVSPHVSDLGTLRGQGVFEQVCADLQRLYGVRASRLLCDRHPDYASTRWARRQGLPVTALWHHRAHASAVAAERPGLGSYLVFAWDGVGYGEDASAWGGETFHGRPGAWRRVASLRPFRLPGGDRAGREPWRAAAALCWEAGIGTPPPVKGLELARQAWRRGLNVTVSSAAGRLFDAAACLVTGLTHASFEGQGPMWLEALAGPDDGAERTVPLPLVADADGLPRLDWAPLLAACCDPSHDPAGRARLLHASLARAIAEQVEHFRRSLPVEAVGLSGGVFQNRRLVEAVTSHLADAGIPVLLPTCVPANDGGLSYGQVVEYQGGVAGTR